MIKDPHSNATPATSTSASKWPQVLATLAGKKWHSVCKSTKNASLVSKIQIFENMGNIFFCDFHLI